MGLSGRPAAASAAGDLPTLDPDARVQLHLLGSQGGQLRSRGAGSAVRAGPSVLLVVDGHLYLFDAGVGSHLRLNEAGFDTDKVRAVFMTHQHTDHNADLGSVLAAAYTTDLLNEPGRRLAVYGPPGTEDYVAGFLRSTRLSMAEQEQGRVPRFERFLQVHELPVGGYGGAPRPVMRDARISVSATRVYHGIVPAFAYRVRAPGLDVVLSGDRGPGVPDGFARFAAGADLLLHEIIDLDIVLPALAQLNAPEVLVDHMRLEHARPAVVGRTAAAARVPKLVLYHLVPGTPGLTDDAWRAMVRPYFQGEIVVGSDLLRLV